MSDHNDEITTTDAGIPASSDEHSLTVGPDGPILLQDHYLIQKMAQFNRERVPERVVHAKGGGAHGYFEVTADVTPFTKAKFLVDTGRFGLSNGGHTFGDRLTEEQRIDLIEYLKTL